MASESVPTLAMSSCTLGIEKAKLVADELQASVLEEIFKHLNVSDLLQVRCACRRWKETVDGCSELMERVLIKFPENLVFDRNYQPLTLVPAKNVTFTESRISSVQTWWPPIGHRLVHLTVKNCEMSFSMLVKVLKHTPELKRLDYLCPSYRAAVVDFGNLKLGKLECLSIDVPNEEILDIAIELRNLFPNLKTLKVLKQISTEALIKRKENLGDVLEEVHLKSAGKLMDGLLQIERLKCLDISGIVTNEMLCKIGDACPKLQSIAVNTEQKITLKPTFLEKMIELQNLTIRGREFEETGHITSIKDYNFWTKIDFTELSNTHLRQICLIGIKPEPFSLQQYLKKSANIRILIFNFCWFESCTEIFTLAEKFDLLEQLELNSIYVKHQDHSLCEYFDNLKFLKIVFCTLPETLLVTFFSLCPQLEEIHLRSVRGITDNVIGTMLKHTTMLQKLTLIECSITDASVEYIAKSNLRLKQVTIENCSNVSKEAVDKLKLVQQNIK